MNRRIQPEILLRGDGWILFFYKWDFIKDFIKEDFCLDRRNCHPYCIMVQ